MPLSSQRCNTGRRKRMANEDIVEQLDQLSEAELLATLNATLAKRQAPPTEQELAKQQARADSAEYERYYPSEGKRR